MGARARQRFDIHDHAQLSALRVHLGVHCACTDIDCSLRFHRIVFDHNHAAMQDKAVSAEVDAAVLARRTPGFSGAELSNLVNEAALLAAKTGAPSLNPVLLDKARDKVIMGVERYSPSPITLLCNWGSLALGSTS